MSVAETSETPETLNGSVPQSLSGGFGKIWRDARQALAALPVGQRIIHIFWLLGPFILLIERSPADAWLTLLALAFVLRVVWRRETGWLKPFWVQAGFAFWGVCLLSAAVSSDPAYALGEAFVWIRFPLFAMASVFWLGRDRRLLYAMLLATALGLVMMCGILTAEILIEGQKGGRLSWPYGDLVPGNYLAKVGLPAFTIIVALAVSAEKKLASLSGILALITLFFSLVTGERINFLIRACVGMLAGLVWRPKWRRYLVLVAVEVLAVVIAFHALPEMGNRYVNTFIEQLPTGAQSPYYRAMMPGIKAFETAPGLGIGTGNFRNMCPQIIADEPNLDCHPHPHNFYIQLAGETGIVGLMFGIAFLGAIIWRCLKAGWRHPNVVLATAWVIPFGLFWPIASSADFFGQWNNIFLWSTVALALSAVNLADAEEARS